MRLDQPKPQIQILLVEDDKAVRILLMELLSQEGYTALSAEDGLEATALLSKVTPELVITDFNMPRMDGWELAVFQNHLLRVRKGLATVTFTGVNRERMGSG